MSITTTLTECPHCQAVWGFEEIEFQQCDACGYPLNDDSDDETDFEFGYPDYDETDDVERPDPGDILYH